METTADNLDDLFRDKTKWGNGPWLTEPDRLEWRDEVTGLPCLIVRNPHGGALCGYVAVPPGHPAHGKQYDALSEISVHGGLTYTEACQGQICHVPAPGEQENVWWLGFDCAHLYDVVPMMKAILGQPPAAVKDFFPEAYRDIAYVKAECTNLAAQLAAMSSS